MRCTTASTVLSALILTGCATQPHAGYQSTAACVHDQFFSGLSSGSGHGLLAPATTNPSATFARALRYCGDPVPDLTGDTMAQAVAILYHVPFRVDLAKDTKIKNSSDEQIIGVGSLIPVAPMVFNKT